MDEKIKYELLRDAVFKLYMAAVWFPDRPIVGGDKMWEEVRDAAGIPPGMSPQPIWRKE